MRSETEPQRITAAVQTELAKVSTPSPSSCPESSGSEQRREFEARLDSWQRAGYPLRHREHLKGAAKQASGDWYIQRQGEQAQARDAAWSALQERGGCVVLLGPRGSGKTQLAAELGLQAARKGLGDFVGGQQYRVLGELFCEEKRTFGRDAEPRASPLDAASRVELLVLDEIQERFESAWEDRELTMLFDRRYREMRRTILLANLTVAEAHTKLPASMWSRIVETAAVIECNWPSFRGAPQAVST